VALPLLLLCLGSVGRRLIRMSKCWGTIASERVRDLPGDESLPRARSTTYAIHGHTSCGGTPILDRIDPNLQTLPAGCRSKASTFDGRWRSLFGIPISLVIMFLDTPIRRLAVSRRY
jgi:hypothetical protein